MQVKMSELSCGGGGGGNGGKKTTTTITTTTPPTTTTTTTTTTTSTNTAIRRNAADYYHSKYENDRIKLNEAFGRMKNKSDDDWSSFINIGNYHGKPYLCDKNW